NAGTHIAPAGFHPINGGAVMRTALSFICATLTAFVLGCEGDVDRPGAPGGVDVQVRDTPDLDPSTDHDVDVKPGDVDIDVHEKPGRAPDVDVDVLQPPDRDTRANEDELPGEDK